MYENNSDYMTISNLIEIIQKLRGKDGCPWDRQQTPRSIMMHLLEESYELADAIETENFDHICEELGDVLFQLLFIVELFCEKKAFNIEKVITLVVEKMIRRHPHVFAGEKVDNVDDVYRQWEKIKQKEKEKKKEGNRSVLDSIPAGMPALLRAYKVSDRVGRAGFDWDNISQVMEKVKEEWDEFNEALSLNDNDAVALEFGDILFTLVNVARFANIHPENSLLKSILKFEKRYKFMENRLQEDGKTVASADNCTVDSLWEEAKSSVR